MNSERYKYTPDIEKLIEFSANGIVEKSITAQARFFTETAHGYDVFIGRAEQACGVITIDLHYGAAKSYTVVNQIKVDVTASAMVVIFHHSGTEVKIREQLNIEVENGAKLKLAIITDSRSLIVSDLSAVVSGGGFAEISVIDISNQCVVRNQTIQLAGDGAECSINGLYLTDNGEHVDNYIKINHLTSHTTSRQFLKGVVGGHSTAAFTGHIFVAKEAFQTSANQQNHNILISEKARINSRPWLEIYNDDVKCSHGATVGRLDAEVIYYMRQRGISEDVARLLQIEGFAEDVVRLDEFGELQNIVKQKIASRLAL